MVPLPPEAAPAPEGPVLSPPQASRAKTAPAPRPMPSSPRRLSVMLELESDRWVRMRERGMAGPLASGVSGGWWRASVGAGVPVGGDREPQVAAEGVALVVG